MQIGKRKAGSSLSLVIALLAVAGLCFAAGGAFAQTAVVTQERDPCPPPTGAAPSPDPAVTAQQVEDGSATLAEFAEGALRRSSRGWAPTCSRRNSLPTRDAGCDWRAVRGVPVPRTS